MLLSQDIKPISYVKANSVTILEQVNAAGPMVITQNGEVAAVLMGVKDYEQLQEGIGLLKILSLGEKSLKEEDRLPAQKAFASLISRIAKVRESEEHV